MKIHLIVILVMISQCASGITDESKKNVLPEEKVAQIFTSAIKKQLGIIYPIFRVYSYSDKAGSYYLVLTEHPYKEVARGTLYDRIMGFCLKVNGEGFEILWKMKDFIYDENSDNPEEFSIWFWTKYFNIKDFDNDGMVDPILIYGTAGLNNFDDGRLKILVYYQGKKRAIRHQNGISDFARFTQVDNGFYSLPSQIQKHVRNLMEAIESNDHALFSSGYENQMDAKKIQLFQKEVELN